MRTPILILVAITGLLACTQRPAQTGGDTSSLTGIEWKVTQLEGQPAALGAGGKPATLQLDETEHRATGFGGCNRFAGNYQLGEADLTFSALMMTKMACDAGMELEQAVARALGETRHYRLTGGQLELLDDSSVVVARLEKS